MVKLSGILDSFNQGGGDGKVSFVDIRDIGLVAVTVLSQNKMNVLRGKSHDLHRSGITNHNLCG